MYPDSRPYPKQQQILEDIATYPVRIVRAGNQSGKSAIGGREVSWVFNRTHPYWTLPERPLKLLVIGRVGEQVESELWRSKIKPFLTPGTYKEIRIGNILQRVEHENGNLIIFMSHHNIKEAREKAQSFVMDYVWLDEQVGSLSFFIELVLRIQARQGRLLWTYTPLIKNYELVKYSDNLDEKVGKLYALHMLDNPLYVGRHEAILAQFANMSPAEREARLFGVPFAGDNAVYDFSIDTHVQDPVGYDPSWRHLELVDPAASGKAGYALLAEHPKTHQWFLIRDEYIKGAAASDLIPQIAELSAKKNIVRRISDPHEAWFIKEAAKQKITYSGVHRKNERKHELIKNLQESLNCGRLKVASWCIRSIEEFSTCQWAESGRERIVGSSRFHLLDCLQYGVDNLPKAVEFVENPTYDVLLRRANKARIKKEQAGAVSRGRINPKIWRRRGRRVG